MDELVWYAAYGSNLKRERFDLYLTGGDLGGPEGSHEGSRNRSPAQGDLGLTIPYALYFAMASSRWDGGGVAFVGQHPNHDADTRARAYLIPLGQFEDVLAQENRAKTRTVDPAQVEREGRVHVHEGWYGVVVSCGRWAERPVLTFTAPWDIGDVTPRAPAPKYLRTMGEGLSEAFGLTLAEAARYLAGKPGVAGAYSIDDLIRILADPGTRASM